MQASEQVAEAFVSWTRTPMGEQLVNSENHQVAAFRGAWSSLPPGDLPDGPGPAIDPYRDVARTADALVQAAQASGRFTGEERSVLQRVADSAGDHAARLAATQAPPKGQTPSAQGAQQQRAASQPSAFAASPGRPAPGPQRPGPRASR